MYRRFTSSLALAVVCVWLLTAGGQPDPFEKGYANCLDSELEREDKVCLIGLGFATGGGSLNQPPSPSALPIQFEMNLGQIDTSYQFAARGAGQTAFLNASGVVLDWRDRLKPEPTVIAARLVEANPRAGVEPLDPVPTRVNYFYGKDPNKWVTDIPVFSKVKYANVYPGIDVIYYGNQGQIEQDFIVHPGQDPNRIQIVLDGASESWIDGEGNLQAVSSGRRFTWRKPTLYQDRNGSRRKVEGRYRVRSGHQVGFETGPYDPKQDLVIDPVIAYSTLFGGSTSEGATRTAVDANGNTYLSGISIDPGFPVSPGTTLPGDTRFGDVYVVKLNASGNQAMFTTHFGGAFLDGAITVALDASANVYLAGGTKSQDFPVTAGVLQSALRGTTGPGNGIDCFVSKLSAAGNALLYSTYLGGTGQDACLGLAVDSAGNAFVAGWTSSTNFPVSDNAPQRLHRGGNDAFAAKLNPAGTGLVWSTFLGGTASEEATAIAIDAQGNAYLTGHTNSSLGFPVTSGVLQPAYRGSAPQAVLRMGDAFAARINADGSFGYVTYLGGSGDEVGGSIAVDSQGNAYIAGSTTSTNFPTTTQAIQTAAGGRGGNNIFPGGDGFVAKLNPTGSTLIYSTYLGGSQDDWASAISVDASGNAWIAGATLSPNFPVTQDATQRTYAGGTPQENFPTGDAFVAKLNGTGTALVFSTYLGGSGDDFAMGVALDRAGAAYVSGSTRSSNFPVTPGALQTQYGGQNTVTIPLGDAFLVKFGDSTGGGGPSNVSVSAVASAASYVGGTVAPGEIALVAGSNIGPAALTTLTLNPARDAVTTLLAGTRILFDGIPAPLIYVSDAQSSAIVPYGVAGRTSTEVVVEYNGSRSAGVIVPVVASKPALFTANASGRGAGAILNQDLSLNSASRPARKGDIVVLYGTGEGQTNPVGVDGRLALLTFPRPVLPISVSIGGINADVAYAGAAPQQVAGLFQINVKVPENAPSGAPEVIVTVGTARSQTGVTVAVQ